ncbi:MAG: transcriptional regulator [Actinomycetota bacterium]
MSSPPLDRLIHEPARLRLVTLLYVIDEADFVYLSSQTGLTAGNISSHMTKLEGAGYVEVEKSFVDRKPRTVYHLTDEGRRAVEQYRDTIDKMLSGLDGPP